MATRERLSTLNTLSEHSRRVVGRFTAKTGPLMGPETRQNVPYLCLVSGVFMHTL